MMHRMSTALPFQLTISCVELELLAFWEFIILITGKFCGLINFSTNFLQGNCEL